jgi:predicted ATPase
MQPASPIDTSPEETMQHEGFREIRIAGFCSLKDVVLRPGRLTVLIGPNGAGKSNLLQALRLIPMLRTSSLQNYVSKKGFASALLHYGPKVTESIEVGVVFTGQSSTYSYNARLGISSGDTLYFETEDASKRNPDQSWTTTTIGGNYRESQLQAKANTDPIARVVNNWISRMTFYHFHDTSENSKLRTTSRREEDRYPRSDGSNLAAYLLRLKEGTTPDEQKAWQRINRHCRHIAPAVKELDPVAINNSVRLDWIDDQDERFGCLQLSDGTLRALALITVLSQPTQYLPKLISIDEPELGLHPSAIGLILELCRSISRHTQIILATQSTELLDYCSANEVVVVERQQAETQLTRLSNDDLQGWLEDYSLSELYNKGVIGGKP